MLLTSETASHFASIALGHIEREFPYHPAHVLLSAADLQPPRLLHPIFFGSFDWHSCVHAHWLLARLLRLHPTLPQAPAIIALFNAHFTPQNVATELAYFQHPARAPFERPYGWAWLLKLAAELLTLENAKMPPAQNLTPNPSPLTPQISWSSALHPLTQHLAHSFLQFLPKAPFPTRTGTHFNSAFALRLSLDYAHASHSPQLLATLTAKAKEWYSTDAAAPAWEPDATDFLSPTLIEAECMRRALPASSFLPWVTSFLPHLASRQPAVLFAPVTSPDRTDGQLAHLDGLNLSRAWCLRSLASALPASDPRRPILTAAAQLHLQTATPHLSSHYAGEHWLATFALLALTPDM